MNNILCEKCGNESDLIGYDYVCHNCKRWVGKKCEVYSRVVGYYRPTENWNPGKQQEYKDRINYKIKEE